jgi:plasmid stabilization system protein ParE
VAEVVFAAEAEADALDAFAWYDGQRPGLGAQFRDAVDAAVADIAEAPLSYAVHYRDLRRMLVRRFPYAVYYRVHPHTVVVVAIVHGRRHSRVWQGRQ